VSRLDVGGGRWAAWRSMERLPVAADEWVLAQVDFLHGACPFVPEGEQFLLDPGVFDSVTDVRDRVRFLLNRHRVRSEGLAVYLHAGLTSGGRPCAGCAQYPVRFDTSGRGPAEPVRALR